MIKFVSARVFGQESNKNVDDLGDHLFRSESVGAAARRSGGRLPSALGDGPTARASGHQGPAGPAKLHPAPRKSLIPPTSGPLPASLLLFLQASVYEEPPLPRAARERVPGTLRTSLLNRGFLRSQDSFQIRSKLRR